MACGNEKEKLRLVFGDVTLGVHTETLSCIFSYQTGGLESLVIKGKEWLYRTPRPAFWRALTDNDRGNGFHIKSGMWLAADQFMKSRAERIEIDGKEITMPTAPENNCYNDQERAERVRITFSYETITIPKTTVSVTYEIKTDEKIYVTVHYNGKKGLPELPVFGMRFIMPKKAEYYEYEGLSGETYPDRMAGGKEGIYRIDGLPVTKYLVPQDCNVHVDTKWLKVTEKESSICFEQADKKFAFSCIPYTPQELENAMHQEELPPARRTVVSILGAVRGVGGIDSWGSNVEEAYHIDAEKDICYSFVIRGI